MIAKLIAYAKANPAVVSGLISGVITMLAGFGLHLTTDQITLVAVVVSSLSHGAVHVATGPAGKHEDAAREAHL
jgi:uncharacterized membrane protein (UPF0136 family)